jgi:hypothetical protein
MESRSTHGKLARLNGLFLVYLAALGCFDCAVGIELATVKAHVERGTTSRVESSRVERGLVYVPSMQQEKKIARVTLLVGSWMEQIPRNRFCHPHETDNATSSPKQPSHP